MWQLTWRARRTLHWQEQVLQLLLWQLVWIARGTLPGQAPVLQLLWQLIWRAQDTISPGRSSIPQRRRGNCQIGHFWKKQLYFHTFTLLMTRDWRSDPFSLLSSLANEILPFIYPPANRETLHFCLHGQNTENLQKKNCQAAFSVIFAGVDFSPSFEIRYGLACKSLNTEPEHGKITISESISFRSRQTRRINVPVLREGRNFSTPLVPPSQRNLISFFTCTLYEQSPWQSVERWAGYPVLKNNILWGLPHSARTQRNGLKFSRLGAPILRIS